MKLAFLFNYPLVDRVNWKKEVVSRLINQNHQVDIYYGKTNPAEYIKSYLISKKHGSVKKPPNIKGSRPKKNISFFKANGIKVIKVKNFNSARSISKIKTSGYNYVFTAIDQILNKRFVNGINTKIVNIHYGKLPEIKGMNAIEWNYMVYGGCDLCLHFINEGIDTGDIIKNVGVPVEKGDNFFTMREKIQEKIPNSILDFISRDQVSTVPNIGGKAYTYMHSEIKNILLNPSQ